MDEYSIKFLTHALRDLDGIYAYIARTLLEPQAARKLTEEIEEEILSLAYLPSRCPERRQGVYAGKGYRQLFVKNYTVIFRVDEAKKEVIIVTIRYYRMQT